MADENNREEPEAPGETAIGADTLSDAEAARRRGQAARLAAASRETVSLFVFAVADLDLAVLAAQVEAVSALEAPTPLPRSPPHVLGLVAAGDRILPVMDLGEFLGLDTATRSADASYQRMIIVSAESYEVAVVCDRARGLKEVSREQMQTPTVLKAASVGPYLAAELDLPGRMIAVLNLPALLEAAAVK